MSTRKIEYTQAKNIAVKELKKLIPSAEDITLEGIMFEDKMYEIELTYKIGNNHHFNDKQSISKDSNSEPTKAQGSAPLLFDIAMLMSKRRERKKFFVGENGEFNGFKSVSE